MAGDDVDKKKPDPSIYRIAAERLKVDPKECLVVEDSTVGLRVGTLSFFPRSLQVVLPRAFLCSAQAQCHLHLAKAIAIRGRLAGFLTGEKVSWRCDEEGKASSF